MESRGAGSQIREEVIWGEVKGKRIFQTDAEQSSYGEKQVKRESILQYQQKFSSG